MMFPAQGEHQHPKKRFYRQRAHCNPLNDQNFEVPSSPAYVDWYVQHLALMLWGVNTETLLLSFPV